ncbi:transposable element Tcb1 transposase [Trichonephila clavipes]|nr:transposable element Tcb1 transposase [Trichonephila clavipes]
MPPSADPSEVVIEAYLQHSGTDNCFATFLLQYPGHIFQQNNAIPHTTRVSINCLASSQTLPWSARSPNISPIEHVWDMMGRRLHLPGNVDNLA